MNPSKLRVNWFLCAWHPADNTVEIRSQLDAPSASWFRFFFFPPSSILKSKCYMKALNTRLSRFKSYTHFPRYYLVTLFVCFALVTPFLLSLSLLPFFLFLSCSFLLHSPRTYVAQTYQENVSTNSAKSISAQSLTSFLFSHFLSFFSFFLVNNHKTVVRQEIIVAIFGETWQT